MGVHSAMMECVYFIVKVPFTGTVKIGRTCNLKARTRSHQCSNDAKLDVLYTIKCADKAASVKLEKLLHKKHTDRREIGEWFRMTLNEIEDTHAEFSETYAQPDDGIPMPINDGIVPAPERVTNAHNKSEQIPPQIITVTFDMVMSRLFKICRALKRTYDWKTGGFFACNYAAQSVELTTRCSVAYPEMTTMFLKSDTNIVDVPYVGKYRFSGTPSVSGICYGYPDGFEIFVEHIVGHLIHYNTHKDIVDKHRDLLLQLKAPDHIVLQCDPEKFADEYDSTVIVTLVDRNDLDALIDNVMYWVRYVTRLPANQMRQFIRVPYDDRIVAACDQYASYRKLTTKLCIVEGVGDSRVLAIGFPPGLCLDYNTLVAMRTGACQCVAPVTPDDQAKDLFIKMCKMIKNKRHDSTTRDNTPMAPGPFSGGVVPPGWPKVTHTPNTTTIEF